MFGWLVAAAAASAAATLVVSADVAVTPTVPIAPGVNMPVVNLGGCALSSHQPSLNASLIQTLLHVDHLAHVRMSTTRHGCDS